MKIISVVGKKNTGKTTLTTKIIKELKKRGYKVSSVKHSHHSIEMDKENTDTWRHKNAGADTVVGVGSTTFININKELDLNRILFLIKQLENPDFVIIEGFKSYNYPKIITSPDVKDKYTISEVDVFKLKNEDIENICDLIEVNAHGIIDTLFAKTCGYNNGEDIAAQIRNGDLKNDDLDKIHSYLSVDGKVVGLNRFVSDYIKKSILGIISSLNLENYNVGEIRNIEVIIPQGEDIRLSGKSEVEINSQSIKINQFTNNLLTNTVKAIVESLKTPEDIDEIKIKITDINDDKR